MRGRDLQDEIHDVNYDLIKYPQVISDAWPNDKGGWTVVVPFKKAFMGRVAIDLPGKYANEVLAAAKKELATRKNPEDRVAAWECRVEVEVGFEIVCKDGTQKPEKRWYPSGTGWAYSYEKNMRLLKSRMTTKEWNQYWFLKEE